MRPRLSSLTQCLQTGLSRSYSRWVIQLLALTSGGPSPSIAYASPTPSGALQKRVSCLNERMVIPAGMVGLVMRQLEVRLLGRFEALVDSQAVPADAWAQRRASDLVKLLALAPGHRMPRDEVLEALWPQLGADAAAANLHKAASYARRALGERGAVVLRAGMVELAPDAEVTTDVERFEDGDDSAYGGELLPDQPYEEWLLAPRARLQERRLVAMRSEGRWDEVLLAEPADEEAHRALMRRHVASGDRPAAARQFRLLRDELSRLGAEPSEETLALQRELTRGPAVRATRLLHAPVEGRERELAAASAALRRAAAADGGALLVTGPLGMGKTRLAEAVLAEAEELEFHTLRGAAREEEGRTPYAPIVEALDPLAERRPELAGALTESAQAALARLLPSVRRPGRSRRSRWTVIGSSPRCRSCSLRPHPSVAS